MLQSIPLDRLPHYPSHLVSTTPADIGDVRPLRSLAHIEAAHRAALVDAIVPSLERWGAPAAAIESARRLGLEGSYAVVTGQQAGIATGPLYTLYKALGAVREAEKLASSHPGTTFVPVFWIEADDHDFEEIRNVSVIDRSGVARGISYQDNDPRPRHVGDRVVGTEAFEAFLGALEESLAPTEFSADAMALLRQAYLAKNEKGVEPTLADGFARALYAMLGETPLVVVSSRNPALKRLASAAFVREAENPDTLFDSLTGRTAELQKQGAQTPIAPKRGALFITHDGERRALDASAEEGVMVRGTTRTMTREELVELARSAPETLSPNVALRPIIQDAILPTAIYLGGPSEIAYLDQVHDAYALFGQEPPQTGPRPFVLLIEPKATRVVEASRFTLEQILQPAFNPAEAMIDTTLDAELEERYNGALEGLKSAFGSFADLTTRIDPTLEKSLGAATTGATKGLEDFTKRLRSALKKREQVAVNKLEGARELLLPGGELQERTLSPVYYINKYGLAAFQATLARIDLAPGMMQVVEFGG